MEADYGRGAALAAVIERAFPGARVAEALPLADGFRNSNFKVHLEGAVEPMVLRIYRHDPALCRKELDLIRFLARSVPVPEVIHAEPCGLDDRPPFAVMRFVEGITFRELRRTGDREAIAQAAGSVGETLAAIHRTAFSKSGWLAAGLEVTAPLIEGANSMPRFVDLCLASVSLQARMPADLRDCVHGLMWSAAPELVSLENQAQLVHGDFNKRNVLVREAGGRWSVAAILDWEFAVSSTPLTDFGNFLRFESASRPPAEPHFSDGYRRGGGSLPPDWRRLARLVDLVALCESLTRDWLPQDVEAELVELVQATVEQRECDIMTAQRRLPCGTPDS